jgi:dihydrofolate synthase/folylpolyglutamate synthase
MTRRSLPAWLGYIDSLHPKQIELGLARVRAVAERLDVLAPGGRNIIVAGTNGKGSTAVFTEALALTQGLTVGTTLSPHVHVFNERVRIGGKPLADETLCDCFARVDAARDGIELTYFEFATLVALLAFKVTAVDVAILEVGLGGRLDAFNIVDADIAVITNIALDHQDFLGDDIAQIGLEKAGVLRRDQRAILGNVTASVIARAHELNCTISWLGEDFAVEESAAQWQVHGSDYCFDRLPRGALAPVNCALAVVAAQNLAPVSREQVLHALDTASLPGRFEEIVKGGNRCYLDVGHNPAAAKFVREQMDVRFPARKFVVVLGMLENKDALGVVSALEDKVKAWLTVDTQGARGTSAISLARRLVGKVEAIAQPNMADALVLARSLTREDDGILVLGSFSAVEQARNLMNSSMR